MTVEPADDPVVQFSPVCLFDGAREYPASLRGAVTSAWVNREVPIEGPLDQGDTKLRYMAPNSYIVGQRGYWGGGFQEESGQYERGFGLIVGRPSAGLGRVPTPWIHL